jgi:hypothetical protein
LAFHGNIFAVRFDSAQARPPEREAAVQAEFELRGGMAGTSSATSSASRRLERKALQLNHVYFTKRSLCPGI